MGRISGMVFVVYIGFSGLTNPKATDEQGKEIAILISDTVLVQEVAILFPVNCSRILEQLLRESEFCAFK